MGWWKKAILHEDELWAPSTRILRMWICSAIAVWLFVSPLIAIAGRFHRMAWSGVLVALLATGIAVGLVYCGFLCARRRPRFAKTIQLVLAVLVPLILIVGAILGLAIAAPTRFGNVAGGMFGTLVWLPAIPLMALGGPRRVGSAMYCSKCNYEQSDSLSSDADDVCPECGSAWRRVGGTVRGKVKRRPAFILAGVLLGIVLGAPLLVLMSRAGTYQRINAAGMSVIGTDLLIHALDREKYWHEEEWEVLAQRTLSHIQFERVYSMIADEFDGYGDPSVKMTSVLGPLFVPGRLNDEQVARLLALGVHAYASVDSSASKPGEKMLSVHVFSLGSLYLSRFDAKEWISIYSCAPLHDCESGAVPSVHTSSAGLVSPPIPQPIMGTSAHFRITPCDLTEQQLVDVRAPIMIVAMPAGTSPGPASLGADGSAQPPAGALWSRVVPVTVKVERAEQK